MTQPCLIVFASLRSGSTMLRLMLDAHPGMACTGEHDFLFDFLRRGEDGWTYDRTAISEDRIFRASGLTLPEGRDGTHALADMIRQIGRLGGGLPVLMLHRNLGQALELLPGARVVHMLRDPRDVARSSIGMMWAGTPYFGVDTWLRTERDWESHGQLAQDRTLTISYERLVAAPEETLAAVCDHVDLEFDVAMLNYDVNTSYSRPDPGLAAQWKRKLKPVDVRLVETKVGPLLAACGYEPSGLPPLTPSGLHLFQLRVVNRLGIWRRLVRAYGWRPLVKHRLGRILGSRRLMEEGRREREAITLRLLK